MSTDKKEKPVIVLDEEWQRMIDKNAEDAWLVYCKLNGIDPDAEELPSDDIAARYTSSPIAALNSEPHQ